MTIRHISAQRKRKLQKLGERPFWDYMVKKWAWDPAQSHRVIDRDDRLAVQQSVGYRECVKCGYKWDPNYYRDDLRDLCPNCEAGKAARAAVQQKEGPTNAG